MESVNERAQVANPEATITMSQFSRLIDLKLDSIRATLSHEIQEKVQVEIRAATEIIKQETDGNHRIPK